LDFALAVEGAQAAHLLIDSGCVFHARDANIDLCRRFRRNHVGARPAAHDSDVYRQAFLYFSEAGDSFDLTRQFQNRVYSLLEIEAVMIRLAGNFDEVLTSYFTRGFHGPLEFIGRLEDEHG